MITRLDDELHAQVKAKAEDLGRSVNEFVVELLRAAVGQEESPQERKARLIAEGKLLSFEPVGQTMSRDEFDELARGSGTAVSDALNEARGEGW
ncbi:toxin-antitoxin system HicB family antitoxin [Amycolatopsis suaedae]